MIEIDGAFGEGGGQIVRTSLALSLITGKPFSIENVRAGRKKPGLLRQHLTALNAAKEIGNAEVDGNRLRSPGFKFVPGSVAGGEYHFAIGTAGSCTLVLQTVLPALMIADGPSELTLEGGTHNPYAPPFDFLADAFLPVVNRLGPRVTAVLDRAGFYPAGGGKFRATVQPSESIAPLDLAERGELRNLSVRAVVSNLPKSIAQREINVVRKSMRMRKSAAKAVEVDGPGPGNALAISVESEHVTEVFTGFGERGVRAEAVAEGAVRTANDYLASEVAVGPFLADQLLIPLALSGRGQFTTTPPTPHTTTNVEVVMKFLDVRIDLTEIGERVWRVSIA